MSPLTLLFSCTLEYDRAMQILKAVADKVTGKQLEFELDSRTNLPRLQGGKAGKQERWVAVDAILDVDIKTYQESGGMPGYSIHYLLRIGERRQVALQARHDEPVLPTVKAVLDQVDPSEFDAIHEVFTEYLGEENDLTFSSAAATSNIEVALAGGYGAFARDLIDRVMEQSRFTESDTSRHDLWWERLKELQATLPEDGPAGPGDA